MASYDVASLTVAVIAGLGCGFLNTVASSGSAVSLPILMWIGLHAVNANATNRIPVLIGGIAATLDLARRHKIPWRMALHAAVPVTVGAGCGALLAEVIPSHDLRIFITGAVVAALVLILTKLKNAVNAAAVGEPRFRWQEACWFLIIGLWLGFIVLDGATYMLLALVLAVRMPLMEANAIKSFLLVPTTAVAMLIFADQGSVDWTLGAVMGVGSVAGGLLGARLAVSEQARRWIVGLLVVVIVGELIQLSIRYFLQLIG
jgi:uncharacterized membrane protein YfcA